MKSNDVIVVALPRGPLTEIVTIFSNMTAVILRVMLPLANIPWFDY